MPAMKTLFRVVLAGSEAHALGGSRGFDKCTSQRNHAITENMVLIHGCGTFLEAR